jgi:hypothetical protein
MGLIFVVIPRHWADSKTPAGDRHAACPDIHSARHAIEQDLISSR